MRRRWLVGEGFGAAAQQPAHLIQRVVLVPAVAKGFLLHAMAGLADHVVVQLHRMERVEHPHRLRQRRGEWVA
jgi:hypothetical protein